MKRPSPRKIRKRTIKTKKLSLISKKLLLLLIFFTLFLIGSVYFLLKVNCTSLNNQNKLKLDIFGTNSCYITKTYINKYYNFKIDIPSNWIIEEGFAQNNIEFGFTPTFKVYSPDKKIIISNIDEKGEYFFYDMNYGLVKEARLGKFKALRTNGPYKGGLPSREFIRLKDEESHYPFIFSFTYYDTDDSYELIEKIFTTFDFTEDVPMVNDFITYRLPNGWTENIYADTHFPTSKVITVRDNLKPNEWINTIIIQRNFKEPTKKLEDYLPTKHNHNFYEALDVSTTYIDNIKTIIYYRLTQNLRKNYILFKDNYVWSIEIIAADHPKRNRLLEIDNFIKTLKFK